MPEDRKYVRVYFTIIDDPKFTEVYQSEAAVGTWLKLLLTADASWPASCDLPRWVKPAALRLLSEAGIVDVLPGHRYRIHGLDAERTRRAESAAVGGRASGRSRVAEQPLNERSRVAENRSPDERTESNLAKQSRAETSKAEQNARESLPGDDGRADLEAYLLITRRAPSPRQRQLLDSLLDIHDLTGPQWAADIMLRHPDDPIGAVIEADKVWRRDRIETAKTAERPPPRPRKKAGLTGITAELAAFMRDIDEKRDGKVPA